MDSEKIMTAKDGIRREIRERRRQLDPGWIGRTSELVQQRLLALPEWAAARRICCYLAAPAEVRTDGLFEACRQAGKEVWVPAWQEATGRYECVRLEPGAKLVPGRHGIREPANPAWEGQDAARREFDLVVVPGLAFDRQGGRLGHGGGHYDRLLAQAPLARAVKIGLAFAFQLRDAVPAGAHDARMDIVLTEDVVFRRQE